MRKFLSDISVAKDFLEIHLSKNIRSRCDLNTLQIESGSYIDNDLRPYYADIVYRVKLKDSKRDPYIYTLVEH